MLFYRIFAVWQGGLHIQMYVLYWRITSCQDTSIRTRWGKPKNIGTHQVVSGFFDLSFNTEIPLIWSERIMKSLYSEGTRKHLNLLQHQNDGGALYTPVFFWSMRVAHDVTMCRFNSFCTHKIIVRVVHLKKFKLQKSNSVIPVLSGYYYYFEL